MVKVSIGIGMEKHNLPSHSPPLPLNSLEIAETLGAVLLSQMPSFTSLSRISQLKMEGFSRLYCSILLSTSGVATRGFDPPITPGLIDPVSCETKRITAITILEEVFIYTMQFAN